MRNIFGKFANREHYDAGKFFALWFVAVLAMLLPLSACTHHTGKTHRPAPAPVAQPYAKTPDGKTLVPLNLSELGDDCWFEVNQDARVEPICPPDYGYDTPAGIPTPNVIPVNTRDVTGTPGTK